MTSTASHRCCHLLPKFILETPDNRTFWCARIRFGYRWPTDARERWAIWPFCHPNNPRMELCPPEAQPGIMRAAEQYGVRQRIVDLCTFDITRNPWRCGGLFDAILTDPPCKLSFFEGGTSLCLSLKPL